MSAANISDLPSARASKVRGQISVDKYISWANSPGALNEGVGHLSILEMIWGKTPGRVAHEYLILVLEGTALRLERDAPSWKSVVSPDIRDQCKDTVTIGSAAEHLVKNTDQVLATLKIQPSFLHHSWFIALLELITASSTFYNVYTFNCWWFVYSLWSNLARCVPNGLVQFQVETPDIVPGRAQGLDAIEFSQKLQEGHLSALVRVRGDPAAFRTKRDVEGVSALVELSFRYFAEARIPLDMQIESRLRPMRLEWMHQLDSCRIACWDSDSKLQAATSQLRESRADGRRMKEKLEEGELRRREIEGKNAALKQQAEEGELRRREIEGENAALKQQVEEGELRRREIEENNATLRKKVESQAANIQALTNQLLGRARDTSWTKRNDRSEEMVQGSLAVAPPRRRARSSNGRSTANCPPTALPLPTIPLPKITPREVHQRFDRFLTPGTP